MNPNFLVGAMAFFGSGLMTRSTSGPPSPEKLEAMRQDRLRLIAEQRAASPHVAKAEAKRARKAAKLRAISQESPNV
jgi:hypothetical protein